jgi:fructose-1,6-bisphosphatase/inositol monophosphatase family enzyme
MPQVVDTFGAPPAGADPLLAELADVALACARAAAAVLVAGLDQPARHVDTKTSATDMVSEVDRRSEAAVAQVLAHRRPDDGVLGEEGTARAGSTGIRWVVDPLDGTTNFLFGVPQFAVSVAAEAFGASADGSPPETLVGVVVHPSAGETWAAVRGWGARCNGAPCRVASGRSTLATALVATGFGYRSQRREWQGAVAAQLLPRVRDIRRFGAAALDLCWTAGGRFDCYYEWGLNPWDLAAGALVCAEAGGRVEVLPGRLIVAATPELFDPFRELLVDVGATDVPEGPEPKLW